jgi:hypothetical protein
MPRNTLSDLNNHLFAQLERLGDEDMTQEQLQMEVQRAKAINGVAKNIINNARLDFDAAKFSHKEMPVNKSMPEQFRIKQAE